MPTGDFRCNICDQYKCICSHILRNIRLQTYGRQGFGDNSKALDLLDEIEQVGCNCKVDLRCEVHDKIQELKNTIFRLDVSIRN